MYFNDTITTISDLKKMVEKFVKERDWEKFHTLRNLAESICIEAAELLEIFQWGLVDENSKVNRQTKLDRIKEELADILIYCISLANQAGIDIAEVIACKIKKNAEKYPVKEFKGFYEKRDG